MIERMDGAYSEYKPLTDVDKKIFADVMEHFVGVKYDPLVVATQVVNGENLSYFCNASLVGPNAIHFPAMVTVYYPAGGKPGITHIQRLNY